MFATPVLCFLANSNRVGLENKLFLPSAKGAQVSGITPYLRPFLFY